MQIQCLQQQYELGPKHLLLLPIIPLIRKRKPTQQDKIILSIQLADILYALPTLYI